ncbi:MAG: DNA alkylation repair protein [Candidatus Algichlamydia australiensis]|nr:DNA alkylation repair protein [Chlamydiales bacterium]
MISYLKNEFLENAAEEERSGMEAYLKNHFPFYGIKKPLRAILMKETCRKFPIKTQTDLFKIIKTLWGEKKRELHYAAIDIADHNHKLFDQNALGIFEELLRKNSWWDTVDRISSTHIGPLSLKFPKLNCEIDRWILDKNMWIRRSAIIYQLKHKEKTDEQRLFSHCKSCMHEQEFFIRKAIGWALRQYSKTNPESVKKFIHKFREKLSPLSLKEASKYLV